MDKFPSKVFQGVPTVTLLVGPNKTAFQVHESLLFDASKVFKAAFSSNFDEASNRSMELPEEDVETVEHMLLGLYFQSFEFKTPRTREATEERFWQLAKLNTLADKYDIVNLNNAIIDAVYDIQSKPLGSPQIPVIAYIYANTAEQSPLRKLMVGYWAWHVDPEWYREPKHAAVLAQAPEFAIDLAMALGTKYGGGKSPFTNPKHIYYGTIENSSQSK